MPVYADRSIPANLRKTPADGFLPVESVADCAPHFRVCDGATVREMTDAEKAQYYPPETISDADRAKAELAARDAEGADIRVIEDMLEALISKGVLSLTDLPEAAQKRIEKRQALRETSRGET